MILGRARRPGVLPKQRNQRGTPGRHALPYDQFDEIEYRLFEDGSLRLASGFPKVLLHILNFFGMPFV